LTAQRAYRLGPGGRGELARAICEDPTPAPSAVTGRRFGDLDNIVAMALRKDPARRYTSVEQLIDDVTRYRGRRPVLARPVSIAYRASTFVRRHPIAVASALTAVVVLGLTVIFYTARLAAERDRAQLEGTKAAQVASFLRGIFEVSDPARSKGAEITARELLDRGAERVQTDLASQPDLQAEMLSITGDIFTKLGAFDRAESLLQRALDLRLGQHGNDALEVADVRTLLGQVHRAKNDEPKAEPFFRSALAIREQIQGPDHPDVARALLNLASLTMNVPKEERESLIVRARAIQERALGPRHVDVAATDEQLAVLYWMIGRYKDMLPLYERALAVREASQGSDHPDVAQTLLGIGSVHRQFGDLTRAEAALQRALAIQERALGADHPTTGWTVNNLASLYNAAAKDDLAEAMFRRYLSIAERSFGAVHNQTAIALGNFGDFYLNRGRFTEAAPLIERAFAIQEKVHGPSHPNVAWGLALFGALRQAQARYEAAERLYARALAIREAHSGPESPAAATCLVGVALAQAAMGRHREAELSFKRALAIREQTLGPSHADVGFVLRGYATSLRALGRIEEAVALERRIPAAK
jgi:serine/threonine-protein kinase